MALHHASSGVAVLLRVVTTVLFLALTLFDLYSDYNMYLKLSWAVNHYEAIHANQTETLFCTCKTNIPSPDSRFKDPNFLTPQMITAQETGPLCEEMVNQGTNAGICNMLLEEDAAARVTQDCGLIGAMYGLRFEPLSELFLNATVNVTVPYPLCQNRLYINYQLCVQELYFTTYSNDTAYALFAYGGLGEPMYRLYSVRAAVLLFFVLAIMLSFFFVVWQLRGAFNVFTEWRHENDDNKSICFICVNKYKQYKDNSEKTTSFKRHLRTAKLHVYIYTLQDLPQHLLFFVGMYLVFAINPLGRNLIGETVPCPVEYGGAGVVEYATTRMRATVQQFDWPHLISTYSSNVRPTTEIELLNAVVFSALASALGSFLMLVYNAFGFVHKVQYVARDGPCQKFLNAIVPTTLVIMEMMLRMGFPIMMIGVFFLFEAYTTLDPVAVFWGSVSIAPVAFVGGTIVFCTLRPRLIRTFPSLVRNTSFEIKDVDRIYRDRFHLPFHMFEKKENEEAIELK